MIVGNPSSLAIVEKPAAPGAILCEECGEYHWVHLAPTAVPCMAHAKVRDAEGNIIGKRPCENPAMISIGSRVCRSHGATGGRPITHGRYSRMLPHGLLSRLDESLKDPELLSLRNEIALIDELIASLLKETEFDEEGNMMGDRKQRAEFLNLVAGRRKAVESERIHMEQKANFFSIMQLNILMRQLVDIIKVRVSDQPTINLIVNDIKRITAPQKEEE